MRSNQALADKVFPHNSSLVNEGKLDCFLQEGNLYRKIDRTNVAHLSPKDLLGAPFVFRFKLSCGPVYFTEDEEALVRFQNQGKPARRLSALFEAWRKDLIKQGLPQGTSIYLWPLGELEFWLNTFQVFPGSKIVYQGPIKNWEGIQ